MMRNALRRPRLAAVLAAAALLSGCAEGNFFGHLAKRAADDHAPTASTAPGGIYKIGKPYQIQGVWYYPQEDYDYDETGIASWYGPDFHGKLTANGETFDQDTVTAAHKTLPLPSVVKVTNLDNGRTLVVRINDRGPFVNGRIIDLSRRSAQMLGIVGPGTAKVRVQVMAEESRAIAQAMKQDAGAPAEPAISAAPRATVIAEALPPPGAAKPIPAATAAPAPTKTAAELRAETAQRNAEKEIGKVTQGAPAPASATNIYVQAGSFSRYDNALRLSARLSAIGKANISETSVKGQTIWRVRLGPATTVDEADKMLDQVISAGQQDARVVVD